jgi:hypothetical protein
MKLKNLFAVILLGMSCQLFGWGRQYHGRCRQFVGNYGEWLWCMHGFCNLLQPTLSQSHARCCTPNSPCCNRNCAASHPLPATLDAARQVFRTAEHNPQTILHLGSQGNFHHPNFHALWRYFVRDCGNNKRLVENINWDNFRRQGLPENLQDLPNNQLVQLLGNAFMCKMQFRNR